MKKANCRKVLKIAAMIVIASFIFILIVNLIFPIVLHNDVAIDVSDISISEKIVVSDENEYSLTEKAYNFFFSKLSKTDYIKLHKNSASFVEYIISVKLTNNSDEILHCFNLKSNSSAKILVSENLNNTDINFVYPNSTELVSVVVCSTEDLTQDEVLEYCLNNIKITFLKGAKENSTGFITYMLYQLFSNTMCSGVALT